MVKMSLGRVVTACAVASILSLSANTGARANGATKVKLLADADGSCFTGATSGIPTGGFAIIHTNGNGTLIAEVSLKGATPNHTYTLDLVQTPSGTGCVAGAFQLTTNGNGNGNVNIQEPVLPGTTGAFVLINPSDQLGSIASNPTVTVPPPPPHPAVSMKRTFGRR